MNSEQVVSVGFFNIPSISHPSATRRQLFLKSVSSFFCNPSPDAD